MPKIRYMGDKNCCIHLDTMVEIYMITVLNLETTRDKWLPPIIDPYETDFKVGDMVLLKNHKSSTTHDL